jgi:hypothetical protein
MDGNEHTPLADRERSKSHIQLVVVNHTEFAVVYEQIIHMK